MMSSEDLRPTTNGRKPLGKLASRLEEVRNPWRQVSTLELSHNEAARLATDALLEHGEKEYRRVLSEERELNFLSPLEICYITQHAAKACRPDSNGAGPNDRDFGDGDAVSELTSGTYFPLMSDEEPPMLELGWPDSPTRYGPSETQIYFQRDKSHNVKDLIRSLINKAKKVIALVMDVFTDVDLLCDLMEASNKRKVPVYILLDEKTLSYFTEMCSALDIQNSHLSNMRIRSVCGDTYCTKSGKKFTGQVLEKFMIIDCEEVIAGSYSFTWLSAQVHSNMVMHFSGRISDSFDREFRCLYADSQIIDCFYNPEEDGPYYSTYHATMVPDVVTRLDLFSDRQREKMGSEYSSSQSSNSLSSVKTAPGMISNMVFKVTQGHNKMEPNANSHLSPERRGGDRGGQTLTPQSHVTAAPQVHAGKGTNHSPVPEQPTQTYSQPIPEPPTQTYSQPIPERPTQTHSQHIPERPTQTHGQPIPERPTQTHGQPIPERPTQIHGQPIPERLTQTHGQPISERLMQTHSQQISERLMQTHGQPIPEWPPSQSHSQPIPERPPSQTHGQPVPERPPSQTHGQRIPERPPSQTHGQPIPERPLQTYGQPTPERPLQTYGQPIPERPWQTYGQPIPERPPQNYGQTIPERPPQTHGQPIPERPPQTYGQPMGIEWSKPNLGDIIRSNVGSTSSKFQALGLYDHKASKFHSAAHVPSTPTPNLSPKTTTPSPSNDSKVIPRPRTSSNQFLAKLQDRFLPSSSKEKDVFNFRRPPSPHSSLAWGEPDLSPTEPESQQSPPPPPLSPTVLLSRHDQKRMTLGHSKLDLVNQYNKMKCKQVYSRFELKNSNVN